jgi:RecA-family ATPase
MEAKAFEVKPLRLGGEEPRLRDPVVEGLVRRGEVVNWIGAPKTGKTWLAYTLLAKVLLGQPWAEFRTRPGKVLLIDNELHAETGEARLWRVFRQAGIPPETSEDRMAVAWCRGRRGSLEDLEATVRAAGRGAFSLVVIDALYRFIPRGTQENDNSDMTQVYNHLDAIAAAGDCAILCVHHASKGSQAAKGTMDVGAGAGAIGRAVDGHVVFLEHEEPDCLVMMARTRSFQSPASRVIQVDWSSARVWVRDDLKPEPKLPEPPKKKAAPKDRL